MIIAYDSTNPWALPANAAMVVGYLDGKESAWAGSAWSRFTGVRGTNTVLANPLADGCDYERGNADLAQVANCMRTRYSLRKRSRLYFNNDTNNYVETVAYLNNYLPREWWDWWAVAVTGVPHLVPGSVMTQYLFAPTLDCSMVDDNYYASLLLTNPSAPSVPAAKVIPMTTTTMVGMALCATGGYWQLKSNGSVYAYGGAPYLGAVDGGTYTPEGSTTPKTNPLLVPGNSATALTATLDGKGYWIQASGGFIYAFGTAPYLGADNNNS